MKKLEIAFSLLLLVSPLLVGPAHGAPTVPAGFKVTLLASGLKQPKGIVSALHRAGAGQFGHPLYVAESGANQIVTVDKGGAGATPFAPTGGFPVGVAYGGGPFGEFLYVGNAFAGGITRVDPSGTVTPFALPGKDISGLDFGRGDYGNDLYAGEWPVGNIWRVDEAGTAALFAAAPGKQTRYLKFSHGDAFGQQLYFTDFSTGDINRVSPGGAVALFAATGSPCLEGFDFSPGGAFGNFLYAGDVCTGNILSVAPDGTVSLWASGFAGVADIHFEPVAMGPGDGGGFTMYISDGHDSVYAVSR